jgi:hypothetical protein
MSCHWRPREVRDRFRPRNDPAGVPLRHLRLRDQPERSPSYLPDVSDNQLEFMRYGAGGAQMAETKKTPEEAGLGQIRAQRELTSSVGTPLVRQEKRSKGRVFGRRRGKEGRSSSA